MGLCYGIHSNVNVLLYFIYRIYRRKYLGFMVAATWIGAFGALIPTWRGAWGTFGLDRAIGSCSILRDDNGNNF